MKNEWRKHEKEMYLPKSKPEIIDIPTYNYFTIHGDVNPGDPVFGDYIAALYTLSYAVRMSYKWDEPPENYYEYTVYPLEGVWDLKDHSKYETGEVDKDNLSFELMIRQPDFVTEEFAKMIINNALMKKPDALIRQVEFKRIHEGLCIQMLHKGSYDDEASTFDIMTDYCDENNLERLSMKHREVYLSDFRRTATENLKTVLRFKVSKKP